MIRVLSTTNDFTDGLHVIRAHLLHYSSLLAAFKRTVNFISNTPNPADTGQLLCDQLLRRECTTLLEEIERLDKVCAMQESRLKYIVDLVRTTSRDSLLSVLNPSEG